VHFGVGKSMFLAMDLTKRNLFEISVTLFVISIASAARAVAFGSGLTAKS